MTRQALRGVLRNERRTEIRPTPCRTIVPVAGSEGESLVVVSDRDCYRQAEVSVLFRQKQLEQLCYTERNGWGNRSTLTETVGATVLHRDSRALRLAEKYE